MKLFILLSATIAVACSIEANSSTTEWKHFKETYNKKYESPLEERMRMAIFKENVEKIREHNFLYSNGEVDFKLGINYFSDKSPDEIFEKFSGFNKQNRVRPGSYKPILPPHKGSTFKPIKNSQVPSSINWVKRGAVTKVKNQSKCGSCYAFAAIGALEGHYYIKNGELISLSEQNVVDCSYDYGNTGCQGGVTTVVYDFLMNSTGVNVQEDYPYKGKEEKCNMKAHVPLVAIRNYSSIPRYDEELLKSAVALGPVSVAVDALHYSFQAYDTGIYDEPQCNENMLTQAMTLVGYGTDEKTGRDYWLLKNSWGESWGEKGYMRMARNKGNMCGIASYAHFPVL